MQWERNAKKCEKDYGVFVAWHEEEGDRYYICPSCGEPVYECDWTNEELEDYICPICEDCDLEEEGE